MSSEFGLLCAMCSFVGLVILVIWAKIERRTLWYGAAAFGWLCITYIALFANAALLLESLAQSNGVVRLIFLAALFVPILVLIVLPLISVVTLLYNGVTVIRREGLSLLHSLALGAGVVGVLYMLVGLFGARGPLFVLGVISPYVTYLLFIFFMYFCTNVANLIHLPQRRLDYIVVLGAGLNGEQVTPLLAARLDRAIRLFRKQKRPCQLIMTGGQGDDELVSEAEAMARYAIDKGIPSQAVLLEDQAVNTEQNIAFSYDLMTKEQPKVAIVTNYYHVYRALVIAKQQGYKCSGYGGRTKFYYALNAYLREFIGYLSITRRQHVIVCGFIFVMECIGFLWG